MILKIIIRLIPTWGERDFLQLRAATREVGIKLVLDGVFNHTGDSHRWFDRYQQGENGACHHEDSPYRGWFTFLPDGRALDWKGNASLPKLNFANEEVAERIYRSDDSVVRYWLRPPYSIDGWRLDVVHMLGEDGGAKGNLHHLHGIYQAAKKKIRRLIFWANILAMHVIGCTLEWKTQQ